jgi:hypothetical protein
MVFSALVLVCLWLMWISERAPVAEMRQTAERSELRQRRQSHLNRVLSRAIKSAAFGNPNAALFYCLHALSEAR